MNKLVLAVAVAAFLSACSSAVKLDEVSVEDKSGQAVALTELSSASKATSGTAAKTPTAVTTLDTESQYRRPYRRARWARIQLGTGPKAC